MKSVVIYKYALLMSLTSIFIIHNSSYSDYHWSRTLRRCLSSVTDKTLPDFNVCNYLTYSTTWVHPQLLVGSVLLILVLGVVLFLFVLLACVPNVSTVSGFSILDCPFHFSDFN